MNYSWKEPYKTRRTGRRTRDETYNTMHRLGVAVFLWSVGAVYGGFGQTCTSPTNWSACDLGFCTSECQTGTGSNDFSCYLDPPNPNLPPSSTCHCRDCTTITTIDDCCNNTDICIWLNDTCYSSDVVSLPPTAPTSAPTAPTTAPSARPTAAPQYADPCSAAEYVNNASACLHEADYNGGCGWLNDHCTQCTSTTAVCLGTIGCRILPSTGDCAQISDVWCSPLRIKAECDAAANTSHCGWNDQLKTCILCSHLYTSATCGVFDGYCLWTNTSHCVSIDALPDDQSTTVTTVTTTTVTTSTTTTHERATNFHYGDNSETVTCDPGSAIVTICIASQIIGCNYNNISYMVVIECRPYPVVIGDTTIDGATSVHQELQLCDRYDSVMTAACVSTTNECNGSSFTSVCSRVDNTTVVLDPPSFAPGASYASASLVSYNGIETWDDVLSFQACDNGSVVRAVCGSVYTDDTTHCLNTTNVSAYPALEPIYATMPSTWPNGTILSCSRIRTHSPTTVPTAAPTSTPTTHPTNVPTTTPTALPTRSPTRPADHASHKLSAGAIAGIVVGSVFGVVVAWIIVSFTCFTTNTVPYKTNNAEFHAQVENLLFEDKSF